MGLVPLWADGWSDLDQVDTCSISHQACFGTGWWKCGRGAQGYCLRWPWHPLDPEYTVEHRLEMSSPQILPREAKGIRQQTQPHGRECTISSGLY